MLFCYSYAAKVGAKHKSLCYCYVIIKLKAEKNNIYQAMYKYHINSISALAKYNLK